MLNIKLILQDQIFCFIIEATVCIISNAKDSKIKPYPFCLCNILKDFTIDNMKKKKIIKKTGFKGSVHVFSVDYNIIDGNYTLEIHKYLMKIT